MPLRVNDPAPALSLPDQAGNMRTLEQYRGSWVLLYFYPKDATPGCTTEACELRDAWEQIKAKNCVVLGVSIDDVTSHEKFAKKYMLPFILLADEQKEAVQAYGVWGEKQFMGKRYMGTARTSFLVDPRGIIAKIYEHVKPGKHAEEVLQDLAERGA